MKDLFNFRWLMRLDRMTRLVILSIVLGFVGAGAAELFMWMLDTAESLLLVPIAGYTPLHVEQTHTMTVAPVLAHPLWWLPLCTTLGGLISGVIVYTFAPEAEGHGTDAAVKAYHGQDGIIRARVPIVKAIASAITIGSGGAAGREGPTAQIAAGVGSLLGRLLRLSEDERRYLVLIGMAAGLSSMFKSPLGAAIFSVEILYSTVAFEGRALIYAIVGASVAYAVTGTMEGFTPLFYLPRDPRALAPPDLLWFLLLGAACGVMGAIVPAVFYHTRDAFRRLRIPKHFKPAIGGLLLGLMGMYLPQLLGGGYGWLQLAVDGRLALWLLFTLAIGKTVAMSLTISSGGSGGVFAPSLFVGTMVGAGMASLIDHFTAAGPDPVAFAVVGMAALFAGAARVPIASLIMVAEMTGGYKLIAPTMLAVAVSYLLQFALTRRAKYPVLYEAQVPRPVDSPVHHLTFYNDVASMLRSRKVKLDDDIMGLELADRLAQGSAIPLGGGELLYSADVASNAAVVGQALRAVRFPQNVLIISILREEDTILPRGDTVLEAGDRVIIAATPQAMEACRPLLGTAA